MVSFKKWNFVWPIPTSNMRSQCHLIYFTQGHYPPLAHLNSQKAIPRLKLFAKKRTNIKQIDSTHFKKRGQPIPQILKIPNPPITLQSSFTISTKRNSRKANQS